MEPSPTLPATAAAGVDAGGAVFAVLAAFCYGLTILFSAFVADRGLPAPTALTVRFAVAGVLLGALLLALGRGLLPPAGERLRMAVVGLVYAVESTFFFNALRHGTAGAVTLLFYAYPAFVVVTELLRGRLRPHRSVVVALALSVGGAAVVGAGGGEVTIGALGVVLALAAAVCFAVYVNVGAHLLRRTDSVTRAAWTSVGAAAGVGVLGAVTGGFRAPSGAELAALLANGAATAGAFALFFVALRRLGPSRTAVILTLEAVFGVALTALFLGEPVPALMVVGGVSVVAGAAVAALLVPRARPAELDPP